MWVINPAVGCHYFPPGLQLPRNPYEGCYQFWCLVNRGTMCVNSLPETVIRQHRGCDLNPGPSATESSTLTTRHPRRGSCHNIIFFQCFDTVGWRQERSGLSSLLQFLCLILWNVELVELHVLCYNRLCSVIHSLLFHLLLITISFFVFCLNLHLSSLPFSCLQCFDAVGWAAGRASGL